MKNDSVYLGSILIDEGKWTRNHFIYYPLTRRIYIDLDSDYSYSYQVNMKNPKKAFYKAKKVVGNIIKHPYITHRGLINHGFVFHGPEEYLI